VEIVVEEAGTTHRARIAKVTSPNGVQVWFEGPNELGSASGISRHGDQSDTDRDQLLMWSSGAGAGHPSSPDPL
jgi:hypothetical protein